MKLTTILLSALLGAGEWQAQAYPRTAPTSGSIIQGGADFSPAQQQAMIQANLLSQEQELVAEAKTAAAQAADAAAQVAALANSSARLASANAARASQDANIAAQMAAQPGALITAFQQAVNDAKQAASEAKNAARQAEIDDAVSLLENERDKKIGEIDKKYSSSLSDFELRFSMLKTQATQTEAELDQAKIADAHRHARQSFQPKNPWRSLGGKTYNAKDENWCQFTGSVTEVRPNGVLIHGDFGPPLEPGFGERDYFVENFPISLYPLADGEKITSEMNFVAHLDVVASTYRITNTTIDLRVITVRKLDYGKIIAPPPADLVKTWNTPIMTSDRAPELTQKLSDNAKEQAEVQVKLQQTKDTIDQEKAPILAEYNSKISKVPIQFANRDKEKAQAQKQAIVDKVLKNNEELASQGDPYGLLRMGERYRDGEGVPKDLTKAKDYLKKAASAGSSTAESELNALSGSR